MQGKGKGKGKKRLQSGLHALNKNRSAPDFVILTNLCLILTAGLERQRNGVRAKSAVAAIKGLEKLQSNMANYHRHGPIASRGVLPALTLISCGGAASSSMTSLSLRTRSRSAC